MTDVALVLLLANMVSGQVCPAVKKAVEESRAKIGYDPEGADAELPYEDVARYSGRCEDVDHLIEVIYEIQGIISDFPDIFDSEVDCLNDLVDELKAEKNSLG